MTSHQRAVEVDTRLAELDTLAARVGSKIETAHHTLHSIAGDSRHYVTRTRQKWNLTDTEATDKVRATLDTLDGWDRQHADHALASLDESQTLMDAIHAESGVLEAEYAADPWSRFFIVQNNNGHIHSHMGCKTCRYTTRFGWCPELSGLTEADAVKAHGAILCTVCFPSAPLEWTRGKDKPAGCAGSGEAPVADSVFRRGMGFYGTCKSCDTVQVVTNAGRVRKHK